MAARVDRLGSGGIVTVSMTSDAVDGEDSGSREGSHIDEVVVDRIGGSRMVT